MKVADPALIDTWLAAIEDLNRCKAEVHTAELILSEAAQSLARATLPDKIKPGEKVSITHKGRTIQVEAPFERSGKAHVMLLGSK